MGLRGAIFDLDGVLTDTASLHRRAWRETFTDCFAELGQDRHIAPFAEEDYTRLVDGRLRIDGARAVIEDRGLAVPQGRPDDGPEVLSIAGIAARKDVRYRELLAEVGPVPYGSSVSFLRELRARGLLIAIATASLHGSEVICLAHLEEEIDVLVDGRAAQAMSLKGKPESDTFVEAARRLGLDPRACVVVEDAPSGVTAGAAAGCRVIALDRAHGTRGATEAEIVVSDLAELQIVGPGPSGDPTLLYESGDEPSGEGVRESLLTLGNGYFATRGARASAHDDGVHYPGTYVAGIFDRLSSTLQGRHFEEEVLVNMPNWLSFDVSANGGDWLGDADAEIEHHSAILDLGNGVLERRYRMVDRSGQITTLLERRIVSAADPHLAAISVDVTAENWSGSLGLRAGIDGAVRDAETVEERLIGNRHLEVTAAGCDEPDVAYLAVRTTQSEVTVAEAARFRVAGSGVLPAFAMTHRAVEHTYLLEVAEAQRVTCEKVLALYTSKDAAISTALESARTAARRSTDFSELLRRHREEWARTWARVAIDAQDGTTEVQRIVNLHLFHLLQVASRHVVHRDVGLGARGLHGEGYLGHVFWDELFVLPQLSLRLPAVARSLLDYRYRRLDAARDAAHDTGHRGAMFPWQSASDGRDVTPTAIYNERSGHWIDDHSSLQRHVGLAVAYNYLHYFDVTGDFEQLFGSGIEVIVEVARFFADLARFDPDCGRYRIRDVMGPDEFHDGYPWRSEPGLDDNAYTNVMTAWLLERSIELVELAQRSRETECLERIGFDPGELDRFGEVSRGLHVPFMDGVIAQFDGYERLEPIDLDRYRARYGDIARLDLMLEAEGDAVRRYQVGKQPDVLMLLYLFSAEELRGLLGRLGYGFDADAMRRTIEFYRARVVHGSSLSRVVHAWITARLDRRASWAYLSGALSADVVDLNRGTTREGIHLGSMAGTVDILSRCYAGLETRSGALWLNPVLPAELESLAFSLRYRGLPLDLRITHDRVEIDALEGAVGPVTLLIKGEPHVLHPGERLVKRIVN